MWLTAIDVSSNKVALTKTRCCLINFTLATATALYLEQLQLYRPPSNENHVFDIIMSI